MKEEPKIGALVAEKDTRLPGQYIGYGLMATQFNTSECIDKVRITEVGKGEPITKDIVFEVPKHIVLSLAIGLEKGVEIGKEESENRKNRMSLFVQNLSDYFYQECIRRSQIDLMNKIFGPGGPEYFFCNKIEGDYYHSRDFDVVFRRALALYLNGVSFRDIDPLTDEPPVLREYTIPVQVYAKDEKEAGKIARDLSESNCRKARGLPVNMSTQ